MSERTSFSGRPPTPPGVHRVGPGPGTSNALVESTNTKTRVLTRVLPVAFEAYAA
ncbi:MAG: hypothetical protein ACREOE_00385 [Gemmatimonadales bacterium]